MSIQINNISKSFAIKGTNKKQEVLKKISLNIEDGEMISIIGQSGAGKSTLLHILGMLDTADEGEYILDGIDVLKLNNSQLAKARNEKIGYVLQDYGLIEDETVLDNVCLTLMFGKKSLKKIKERGRECLKKLKVEHLETKTVSSLSGGEKQRVAIARAIVNNPDYIVADEPTGALDSQNTDNVMNILTDLNEEGKTVIIVTHDIEIAKRCKKIIEIKDGNIL